MPINLLPQDLQKQQESNQQQFVANIVSVVLLVILFASVGIIFSFRVFVTRDYVDVNSNLDEVRQQVTAQEAIEGTLKAIHLKTEKLTEIFDKNYPYGKTFEMIDANKSDSIVFTTVSVENQDSISIEGSTSSLPDLAVFMKFLDKESPDYKGVELTKLNFNDQDFTYLFSIHFDYVPATTGSVGSLSAEKG
ncbi:hypothetical protein GW793_03235 [bacterium]|uniref:PilN domain-containing protein n=2 Tax=Katanobacteria TaxID=422282 RepID=A0A2M7X0B1_UNCKA|nr:hypothetical protein [bacterium]PIP56295.1 MAG: hypothetical protein COX05_03750 [candidate division WWE3 bacterium CG22_combo_CG10-13_8_21_14_all_39_12]PJA39502.1 MAG: hypothetical protein CO179_05075 [candidate division WWE3 bacterium CG_4_9_14_3_um_filter_39_7]